MLIEKIELLKKQITKIPQTPGVYSFYNDKRRVIYVGKANKLKTRLKSYVDLAVLDKYPKTKKMVTESSEIKFYEVSTEAEALILEANLIKQYQPFYNKNLKDDKYYKFIKISKSKNGTYKIETSRKKSEKGSYFGPYPDGSAVNTVLRDIRRVFPYRNCSDNKFGTHSKLGRSCLYGNLGLCPAPCVSIAGVKINEAHINKIKEFLRGNYKKVIKDLKNEMLKSSKNLDFESAVKYRTSLDSYKYLSQNYKSREELLEGIGDLEKAGSNLFKLIKLLSFYFPAFDTYLKDPLTKLSKFKIEFYDISNLGDKYIVGSFITLEGEDFNKNLYRKFKLKTQIEQNDFVAMEKILRRRFAHLKDWGRPDLIVIDGGKGQLSAALKVTIKYKIPTISLAKKEETIFLKPEDKQKMLSDRVYSSIGLSKSDPMLQILVKGRDEVHRFGVTYNRKLRSLNLNS